MGVASSSTRAHTRSTFPSTAAAGRSKQIEAIAPAVYGPMPGSASRPSTVSGQTPPPAPISRAHSCALRARV